MHAPEKHICIGYANLVTGDFYSVTHGTHMSEHCGRKWVSSHNIPEGQWTILCSVVNIYND